MAFFPLVGAILGCLVAGFVWAAWDLWPPYLAGPLGCAWLAFLTRGLHLDGFADMADALGSGAAPERALEIMRDSRSGALGVAALVFLIVLKSSAFIFFTSSREWQWLVMAPCCSRWGLNVLAAASRYARPQGGAGRILYREGDKDLSPSGRADCLGNRLVPSGMEGPGGGCRDGDLEPSLRSIHHVQVWWGYRRHTWGTCGAF